MADSYDIVIIGSGMGGLVCADILGREGYRVCVLEKNKQIGGCLQTYARNKVIFDAGVHYVGALEKGQNLYQVFKYLGLMEKLKLKKMDRDGFDRIIIGNSRKQYVYAQGYENFITHLLADFPGEENAIRTYCNKIREICLCFPLYNLRLGSETEKAAALEISTQDFIESLTNNRTLQAVLAGNNYLYAGEGSKTPFYVHALILNHYIESAWKCIDGGSQISKILAANIRARGGEVKAHCEVTNIIEENGLVTHVVLQDGRKIYAGNFISNMHPAKTMAITESSLIKNAYRNRLADLENSVASFIINIVFKKDSFRYAGCNYYYHKEGRVWDMMDYTEQNWPLGFCAFIPASSRSENYAEGMTLLTYMHYKEVEPWAHTFNTVSAEADRGESYNDFKRRKAEILLDEAEKQFPGLRSCMHTYYTSTPLSFRDYTGSADGSMYGVAKDYKNPMRTFISPKTKLPNLYLTGQNLNLHGILGTSMSAIVTCLAITGNSQIVEKIKNA